MSLKDRIGLIFMERKGGSDRTVDLQTGKIISGS